MMLISGLAPIGASLYLVWVEEMKLLLVEDTERYGSNPKSVAWMPGGLSVELTPLKNNTKTAKNFTVKTKKNWFAMLYFSSSLFVHLWSSIYVLRFHHSYSQAGMFASSSDVK